MDTNYNASTTDSGLNGSVNTIGSSLNSMGTSAKSLGNSAMSGLAGLSFLEVVLLGAAGFVIFKNREKVQTYLEDNGIDVNELMTKARSFFNIGENIGQSVGGSIGGAKSSSRRKSSGRSSKSL